MPIERPEIEDLDQLVKMSKKVHALHYLMLLHELICERIDAEQQADSPLDEVYQVVRALYTSKQARNAQNN